MQTEHSLSPQQIADRLGVSRQSVYRMLDRGDLVGFRVGTARRIRVSDLQSYIEERVNDGR